jgi:tRNA nucleotidyltransferase (CCA-adding enzyme)
VRRLANKVGRIDRLIRVDSADRKGRNQEWRNEASPQGVWLLAMAAKLNVQASMPKRILLGRHLIAAGYKPAGWFSAVLDEAFEAQMDGVFVDEASGLVWLKERMARPAV